MSTYRKNRKTKGTFRVGQKRGYDDTYYPGLSEKEIGQAECKTVDVSLPLDDRVLAEVQQYNKRYGLASREDITLEWNSRCKDPEFQGKEFKYAYTDIPLIQESLDRLVTDGKLRKILVQGAEPSYVVNEGEDYTEMEDEDKMLTGNEDNSPDDKVWYG